MASYSKDINDYYSALERLQKEEKSLRDKIAHGDSDKARDSDIDDVQALSDLLRAIKRLKSMRGQILDSQITSPPGSPV